MFFLNFLFKSHIINQKTATAAYLNMYESSSAVKAVSPSTTDVPQKQTVVSVML